MRATHNICVDFLRSQHLFKVSFLIVTFSASSYAALDKMHLNPADCGSVVACEAGVSEYFDMTHDPMPAFPTPEAACNNVDPKEIFPAISRRVMFGIFPGDVNSPWTNGHRCNGTRYYCIPWSCVITFQGPSGTFEAAASIGEVSDCKADPSSYFSSVEVPGQPGRGQKICGKFPKYKLVIPKDVPKPQFCAGNPIDVSNGAKKQVEVDINSKGMGQISFTRYYNSANLASEPLWHHNYDRKLRVIDLNDLQQVELVSNEYYEELGGGGEACVAGWRNIQDKISSSWAANTTPVWKNGVCQIVSSSGAIVKQLPTILSNPFNPDPAVPTRVPDAIQILRGDGSTSSYQHTGQTFASLNGDGVVVRQVNSTTGAMWRYISKNGDVEEFNSDGKLLSITASNGMKQILTYDPITKLLSKVQDATGAQIQFFYIGTKLSSIKTGSNKITSFIYNPLGLISGVTYPDNTSRLYHYDDLRFPTFLTGLTDERGVRYATWSYDDQGRAVSSEHAGGAEKTFLTFNADGTTTVTNALNKKTIYHFGDFPNGRLVTSIEGQASDNCVAANKNYTYTPEGWVATKTDWNGNVTRYNYNAMGQETYRNEGGFGFEGEVFTTWDPVLNLKTKILVAGISETTFTYDSNGNLLSQTVRSVVP